MRQSRILAALLILAASGVSAGTGARWSVQVDNIDAGDVNIEPAFRMAIYENLVQELTRKNQFRQVFRDGDRNAHGAGDLLILKTVVQSYQPGSETKRAVTTFGGATKLRVIARFCTPDGQVVLERSGYGKVRFFGGNLRATQNRAHNIAKAVEKSALPDPAASPR